MNLLVIRRTNTILYGERAFCAAPPRLWNGLIPLDIRSINSLEFFNTKLKKSLFTLQSQVNDRVHIPGRKCRRLLNTTDALQKAWALRHMRMICQSFVNAYRAL